MQKENFDFLSFDVKNFNRVNGNKVSQKLRFSIEFKVEKML